MKRTALLFSCLALCAGLYAKNTSTPDAGQTDTLRTSVVTGTRVSALRDQIPAPISVVGRETLETSDENVLMPSLMEQVPGLFITSRGVTGYSVSNGAAGAISLRGFGAGSGRVAILIDGHPQFESIYGHPVADEYAWKSPAEPLPSSTDPTRWAEPSTSSHASLCRTAMN